jgi:hypothetical protein
MPAFEARQAPDCQVTMIAKKRLKIMVSNAYRSPIGAHYALALRPSAYGRDPAMIEAAL